MAEILSDLAHAAYRQPLTLRVRRGLLVLVVLLHLVIGWALTVSDPAPLVLGGEAPIEIRLVSAETPTIEQQPAPELESMIQPPLPDLPPPVFTVQAPPPPPPKPQPPKPRPVMPQAVPQQAAAAASSADTSISPKTVPASQVAYLTPPSPIYPLQSRRAGEKGTATVRVLIDVTGRPAQAVLQTSSGHPALDDSAVSAVRAARFRPYAEGGVAQAVWVLIPINFVLQ